MLTSAYNKILMTLHADISIQHSADLSFSLYKNAAPAFPATSQKLHTWAVTNIYGLFLIYVSTGIEQVWYYMAGYHQNIIHFGITGIYILDTLTMLRSRSRRTEQRRKQSAECMKRSRCAKNPSEREERLVAVRQVFKW